MFSSDVSSSEATSGRSDLMLAGIDLFVQNPLGVGTGGFKESYSKVSMYYRYGAGDEKAAHSGWVKILAENGFPGLLALLSFVLSFVLTGWNRRRQGLFAIGFLITASLGLAFLSTEFQGKGLWFLVASGAYFLSRGRSGHKQFREIPKSPLRLMQERKRAESAAALA
jgi:O-antigen ligase